MDELDHAELAFGLAKRYTAVSALQPETPVGNGGELVDIELFAIRWVRHGCVDEAIAAALVGERLRRATDPLVRRALELLADHHGRHAELAYRVVAWAIEMGGDRVRRTVQRRFEMAVERAQDAPSTLRASVNSNELNAHGWLGPFQIAHLTRRAILDVVDPCRARLLRVEQEVEVVARIARHSEEHDAPAPIVASAVFQPLAPPSLRLPAAVALRG